MENKKHIYILITKTNTCIARLIRLISGNSYSHVSLSTEKELKNIYSFCRNYYFIPLPATFNAEYIDKGVFQKHRTLPCEIYRIEVSASQYEKINEMILYFQANRNLFSYDLKGLFLLGLNIPHKIINKYICSVWVASVLMKAGIMVNSYKDLSLIKPEDFRHMESAELHYRGDLKLYSIAQQKCNLYKYLRIKSVAM